MGRIELSFANASCAHCARIVTRRLGDTDGIGMVEVDSDALRVVVHFDPSRVSVAAIRGIMEGAGYPTTVLGTSRTSPSLAGAA